MSNSGNNLVQGNFIGTDVTGTKILGNNGHGIYIDAGSGSNVIGGTTPAARNIISGNSDGVYLTTTGTTKTTNTGNLVGGNYIGTDVTGTQPLGNNIGVGVSSNANTIGGTAPGAGNLISGNKTTGLGISSGYSSNLVEGNYIGTDNSGTVALGNGGDGVIIGTGPSNTLGGTAPGAGNLISGNKNSGVHLIQATTHGSAVEGNLIGTDVTGTQAIGNGSAGFGWGVYLDASSFVTVGGTTSGAGYTIAFNKSGGVGVYGTGNAIQRNSIFSNVGPGISSSASGPVLTSSVTSNGVLTISGSLSRTANTNYVLEFFSNPTGENGGKTCLGSSTVTTDAAGHATFKTNFAVATGPGEFVTATATDPLNTTSGFSNSTPVTVPTPSLVVTGFAASTTAGTAATFTLTARDTDGNTLTGYVGTVHFTSSDPQAVQPPDYTFTVADQGTHTFSVILKTAGLQSISFAAPGMSGDPASILVNAAAATHFAISGPTSIAAGSAFNITVTALDAYGNVATGYTGTAHASSSDPTAVLPPNYAFTTADNGVHTFTGLKLKKKGTQTITFTDTLSGLVIGSLTIKAT